MLTVEESIVIARPVAEVFSFMADPDNVTLVQSNLSDYRVVSGGATEIGRRATFSVRVVGVKLDYTDELVEYEQDKHYRVVSAEGRVPYSVDVTFEAQGDDATQVVWHQESEIGGGVFKLADGLVVKLYAKDVRSNLEKAKALLEA